MPVPSLAPELVDQILGRVDEEGALAACARVTKSWLPTVRHQLYHSLSIRRPNEPEVTPGRSTLLLATLQSYPELAALVIRLSFNGYYTVELARRPGEGDAKYKKRLEKHNSEDTPWPKDDKQLGLLLQCCNELEALRVRGAQLWLEDLVGKKDLVSLIFDGPVTLRYRSKRPELLPLPALRHLSAAECDEFDYDETEDRYPDLDPRTFFFFNNITHLAVGGLIGQGFGPGKAAPALIRLAPKLQTLILTGEPLEWPSVLPLCTSLKQLSWNMMPRIFEAVSLILRLPPRLQLVDITCNASHMPDPKGALARVMEPIIKSLEQLQHLRAVLFNPRQSWQYIDWEPLKAACERKGASLRCGSQREDSMGELLVQPRKGEEELTWSTFAPQCPGGDFSRRGLRKAEDWMDWSLLWRGEW